MRRTYQNIPFAYSSSSSIVPKSRYYVVEDDKTAYAVNKDTVAAYTGDNEAQPFSVQREEKEILGLREAVSFLNDKLARELQMAVDHVELVYCRVALDEKNEKLVMNLFRELNEEGHTIITVTHSDHVGKAAKRIVIIEHGHMREGGEEEKA